MKKLIVLSLVFALLASAAFAVDLSGHIIGTATLVEGNSGKDSEITGQGTLNRVRIDGGGEVADGVFGAYIRAEGGGFTGNAWWKPIDQFKLQIGGNGGDGFIGKEGVTGWGFIGQPADTGVTFGGDNVWGGASNGIDLTTRYAFYESGDGGENVYLFITPIDVLSINVILPFISESGKEIGYILQKTIAQVDVKLDAIGEIALTYEGGYTKEGDASKDIAEVDSPAVLYLYYGNTFGPISIDFGFAYHFDGEKWTAGQGATYKKPIGVGLGLKYATEQFGVKLRTAGAFAGDDKATKFLVDILPYYNLNDKLTINLEAGIGMKIPDTGDSITTWHVNPYIRVGEEWGANFLAGVKLWSTGKDASGDTIINWAVPIALIVSF